MNINESSQYIINENDAIQTLLSGMKISEIVTEETEWVEKFNINSTLFDFQFKIKAELPAKNKNEYFNSCINDWNMPSEYKNMDIEEFIINKCKTDTEKERVLYELELYRERKLLTLLKFLCFFVDNASKNNIILGVGRGSSVSSYVLYLIGIHKVDSIKYDLDIKEFLR